MDNIFIYRITLHKKTTDLKLKLFNRKYKGEKMKKKYILLSILLHFAVIKSTNENHNERKYKIKDYNKTIERVEKDLILDELGQDIAEELAPEMIENHMSEINKIENEMFTLINVSLGSLAVLQVIEFLKNPNPLGLLFGVLPLIGIKAYKMIQINDELNKIKRWKALS